MPETRFALGRRTREYFDKKMKRFGKESIPFYNFEETSSEQTDVNYVGFYCPQYGSNLSCRDMDLRSSDSAFAVLRKTREGGSREPSLTDIRDANVRAVARFLEQRHLTSLADKLTGLEEFVLEELSVVYSNCSH
ncbi:hypothetical protein HY450_02630 [Candidatus Pacearchaeota archaeon]|nr:hypothetical protein [Candidatus Pacearchaeota archaeon]